MEKANQIKAYEEVSKAFTDILRNSLDDEFRFQFYSLLNVTNTTDAQDVLNRNLKQFLKPQVEPGASNQKKLKTSTNKAIQEDSVNIASKKTIQEKQIENLEHVIGQDEFCFNSNNLIPQTILEKFCENEENFIETDRSEDEFGFHLWQQTPCVLENELKENKEQTIEAEETNIEEDEFGFNSSHTTFCGVLEVLNEDKEQNIIAEEPNIEEDEFGFNSNDTIFCSVPEVSDSLQVRSISVLNIEADEFDFYSESNKSITFSASQTNCTEKSQKQLRTSIPIEDDDFGFYLNSEKSIWSTLNEDQKKEDDNMKLSSTEEMELNDLEIWL